MQFRVKPIVFSQAKNGRLFFLDVVFNNTKPTQEGNNKCKRYQISDSNILGLRTKVQKSNQGKKHAIHT